MFRRNACSIVRQRDEHRLPLCGGGQLDVGRFPARCFCRVQDEIQQHLFDLITVAARRGQRVGKL